MTQELQPQQTILLAVTGMSPAVLTETVWALAQQPEPIIPDRVVVVTTTAGARRLREDLFQPADSLGGAIPWQTLRKSLAARGCHIQGKLRFGTTSDDLRVFTSVNPDTGLSVELEDIRNPDDNESVADYLLDQVRMFTENPDTRLIASLAGGRKTMGALLYACMTLAGREEDVLTHVLVNEPFDTIPGFYFPDQGGNPLRAKDSRAHSPTDAVIDLAQVPFVPLRNLFVKELGRQVGSFSHLVEQCRQNVRYRAGETIRLTIETRRPEIVINGQRLRLAPREHLVLCFLAHRNKQGAPAFSYYGACLDPLNLFREEMVEAAPENDFSDWRASERLKEDFDERDVSRLVSDIRRKVQGLGGEASTLAGCLPEKGRFSLDMESSLIEIRA